jgi:hypothetical protein
VSGPGDSHNLTGLRGCGYQFLNRFNGCRPFHLGRLRPHIASPIPPLSHRFALHLDTNITAAAYPHKRSGNRVSTWMWGSLVR